LAAVAAVVALVRVVVPGIPVAVAIVVVVAVAVAIAIAIPVTGKDGADEGGSGDEAGDAEGEAGEKAASSNYESLLLGWWDVEPIVEKRRTSRTMLGQNSGNRDGLLRDRLVCQTVLAPSQHAAT